MNNSICITIFLGAMLLIGWSSLILGGIPKSEKQMSESYVVESREYEEKGLYQLAAQSAGDAIKKKDSKEARDIQLSYYAKAYDQGLDVYSNYLKAANDAFNMYPEQEEYALITAKLYMDRSRNKEAYKVIAKAYSKENGSQELKELYNELKFQRELKGNMFEFFRPFSNDEYAVKSEFLDSWYTIATTGFENSSGKRFNNIGKKNAQGTALYCVDGEVRLIDKKGIIQCIFKGMDGFQDTGLYEDERIAIKNNDLWSIYDGQGNQILSNLEMAGTYTDGKTAIKKDGKWNIVDVDGNAITEMVFDDIKLDAEGRCITKGYMAAAVEKGKYAILNKKFEPVSDDRYSDMDFITEDEIIAVKINDKWGYVNIKGELVISPGFDDAKSYSNGFAAVKKNDKWGLMDDNYYVGTGYEYLDIDYMNTKGSIMVSQNEGVWRLMAFKQFS